MSHFEYDSTNITQCLQALERIETHGATNMLNILFVRQTLMNPIREEVKNAGHQTKCNGRSEKEG